MSNFHIVINDIHTNSLIGESTNNLRQTHQPLLRRKQII